MGFVRFVVFDDAAHRIISQGLDIGCAKGSRSLEMLPARVFPDFQAFDTGRLEDAH